MIDLIKEIENCVKSNNLRCALGMALTLPDICGIIEYPAEKSSKNRYVKWCEKYLFNQGYYPYFVVDDHKPCEEWEKVRAIEPAMCYKLRCAFLHSGNLKLNQKNNDNFPVFNLHISSSMENGIYVDKIVSDSKEISMDIRKLARLLCNAAKDYYDSYEDKQAFIDHHIRVMDNEKTANENKQDRDRHEQRQSSKSNVHNYNELSDKAKSIFHKVQCGQKVATDEELMSDKEIMFAVHELIEGGFLIIHSNEEIYK